jgi:hypothetical protein
MKNKKKVALGIALILFSLAVSSVFADPPPNGTYYATGQNVGEASVMIHFMPYRQLWEVNIFNRNGDRVGSYETKDYTDRGSEGTYFIRFGGIVLRYSHTNGFLDVNSGNLPAGVGSRFRLR